MLAKTVYYERRVEHNYWKKTVVSTGCGLFVVVCLFFGLLLLFLLLLFCGGVLGRGERFVDKKPLDVCFDSFY